MFRPIVLLGLAALLCMAPHALAAGAEFAILDAYLAESDLPSASGEHCDRRGGHLAYMAGETPMPPATVGPTDPTNTLLEHHFMWHRERSFLLTGISADDADQYGAEFVAFHRTMLADFDAWRDTHGHPATPLWDPATPIPAAFAYDGASPLPHEPAQSLRHATGSGCIQHREEDPGIARPTWTLPAGGDAEDPVFGYSSLCEFPDLNRLGKAVDWDFVGRTDEPGYHGSVHGSVGGDLSPVATAPRDPIFWAWHKYLEIEIFQLWEDACGAPTPEGSAAGAQAQNDVPVPLAALVLSALVIALAKRRS